MNLVALLLIALVSSVQPVYVYLGEEPVSDPQVVLEELTSFVDESFVYSSQRDLVVEWDEVEVVGVGDSSWGTVYESLSRRFDDKRVIAAVEQGESPDCGLADKALHVNEDQQRIAAVWERCWDGDLFLHELLHISSAVSSTAPSGEDTHSTNSEDVMYPRIYSTCGEIVVKIDCLGDSYFNPNPVEGSWLYNHPEFNIVNAEYLKPQETSEASDTGSEVGRIAGSNRFETAAMISQRRFPNGVSKVYIANGSATADALTGSGMLSNAPLLLVTKDQIPNSTREELLRLNPDQIIIFGGRGVVSSQVQQQLEQYIQ